MKALQSNFKQFVVRQKEQKVTDIMENCGCTQREAEVALEFCSNNEVRTLQRLKWGRCCACVARTIHGRSQADLALLFFRVCRLKQ